MSSKPGAVVQVVERLPCKYEALNSSHSTTKSRKKKKRKKKKKENITKKVQTIS
jgi:hypothetical protein